MDIRCHFCPTFGTLQVVQVEVVQVKVQVVKKRGDFGGWWRKEKGASA